jgi:hypothetical protein
LGPRVKMIPRGPCDLDMAWWTEVMRRQGGCRVPTPYNDDSSTGGGNRSLIWMNTPMKGLTPEGTLTCHCH